MLIFALAFAVISCAQMLAMNTDNDYTPFPLEALPIISETSCASCLPLKDSANDYKPAPQLKDELRKGILPENLFLQLARQSYKIEVIKKIASVLRQQIVAGNISASAFNKMTAYHRSNAWYGLNMDPHIKKFVNRWCNKPYNQITPRSTDTLLRPDITIRKKSTYTKKITRLSLSTIIDEQVFRKAGLPTCRENIKQGKWCPALFKIIEGKKDRRYNKPVQLGTLIELAKIAQKYLPIDALQAMANHLKNYPLCDDPQKQIVQRLESPILAQRAKAALEVTK